MKQRRMLGRIKAAMYIYRKEVMKDKHFFLEMILFLVKGHSYVLGYWYVSYLLFHFCDKQHFKSTILEVFYDQVYNCKLEKKKMYILDIGANIGTTVGYFKNLFPESHICAYEPNPQAFSLLEENIVYNCLENVKIFKRAVVSSKSKKKSVDFYASLTTVASTMFAENKDKRFDYEKISVKNIAFSKVLQTFREIDILKIDIEGEEYDLIDEIVNNHKKISLFIIEFHGVDKPRFYSSLSLLSVKYQLYSNPSPSSPPSPPDRALVIGLHR